MEAQGRSMTAPTASRPTATVLTAPSTNHPRIHRTDRATFDTAGVLAPACASADSRRDIIEAARSRRPRYRGTSAAVSCETPRCRDDADPANEPTTHPGTAEPPCP